MSQLHRIGFALAVNVATPLLLTFATGSPAYAVIVCSADCESEVIVDTTASPCTYTWADRKFQVPPGLPIAPATLTLRWKLKGPASAIWTNDGIFLRTPENDPDKDLTSNAIDATVYYKWEVVHSQVRTFTIDMNIFNGSTQCIRASMQGDYQIELQ